MILGVSHEFKIQMETNAKVKNFECYGNRKNYERPFVQYCSHLDRYFSNEFLRTIDKVEFEHRFKTTDGLPLHQWFDTAKETARYTQ